MSGNTFGKLFTLTTFGESHGPALGAIVDGVPPGIELTEADLQGDLDRRRPGTSKYTTKRQEPDQVEILSGVFQGKTTGTPIGLLIKNTDQRSQDYGNIAELFRPGHADYTYHHKYKNRDYRGGGRSSARETAMRVAAGAIAKKVLKEIANIEIIGFVSQIGEQHANYQIDQLDYQFINSNQFFTTDQISIDAFDQIIRQVRKDGDSIGAQVKVVVKNTPVGLGEPIFDRLDADLAHALMSINAVKAVEIGDGVAVVAQKGSQHRDQITQAQGFLSNHAGGILGGISSGQDIIATIALKPTSSIEIPGQTIDIHGQDAQVITKGRHDPCVGIRAVPIAEAMTAIVILDHLMRHHAQCKLVGN